MSYNNPINMRNNHENESILYSKPKHHNNKSEITNYSLISKDPKNNISVSTSKTKVMLNDGKKKRLF